MTLPDWTYRRKKYTSLSDFPETAIGFVYEVRFSNGQKYIGKKALSHRKKLPPLKGKKRVRIASKESDWKNYWGSIKRKDFVSLVKSGDITIIDRRILKICHTQTELTYFETKFLFSKGVLESDEYLNSNILGKFYGAS